MTIKIGINGLGRIGRMVIRSLIENNNKKIEIKHINSRSSAEIMAPLLKYDSVHGKFNSEITNGKNYLNINGKKITFSQHSNLNEIKWKNFGVDYVLECTGKFNSKDKLISHIKQDFIEPWETISKFRKPIIASVAGYALGGGCEIAMMCDIIVAADNAKFGQPEINLGTIPAAGGTQRLVKSVGKSKAMELVLSGKTISATEALNYGLVSKVVSIEDLERETTNLAENIASKSLPVLILAKEAILRSFESTLSEGMINERRLFQSTFELEDRKEGMEAFLEKRLPKFKNY